MVGLPSAALGHRASKARKCKLALFKPVKIFVRTIKLIPFSQTPVTEMIGPQSIKVPPTYLAIGAAGLKPVRKPKRGEYDYGKCNNGVEHKSGVPTRTCIWNPSFAGKRDL